MKIEVLRMTQHKLYDNSEWEVKELKLDANTEWEFKGLRLIQSIILSPKQRRMLKAEPTLMKGNIVKVNGVVYQVYKQQAASLVGDKDTNKVTFYWVYDLIEPENPDSSWHTIYEN